MHSENIFGFIIRNTILDQTLQEKQTFEKECFKHGVRDNECRADNGYFVELGFKCEVEKHNQVIIYYGVGAAKMA